MRSEEHKFGKADLGSKGSSKHDSEKRSCILGPWSMDEKKEKVTVTQSCPTLCDAMDYSLPGSSVHGILQARILERVVIPSSRGASQPRDRTCLSCTASGFFTH